MERESGMDLINWLVCRPNKVLVKRTFSQLQDVAQPQDGWADIIIPLAGRQLDFKQRLKKRLENGMILLMIKKLAPMLSEELIDLWRVALLYNSTGWNNTRLGYKSIIATWWSVHWHLLCTRYDSCELSVTIDGGSWLGDITSWQLSSNRQQRWLTLSLLCTTQATCRNTKHSFVYR